jgi:hypothetical protein
MLTAAVTKKPQSVILTIANKITLVNSTSTALPIGLLPKEAKFCHTSNILLVGRQCRRALLQLYFNSSVSGSWLLVGWSTIRVPGL